MRSGAVVTFLCSGIGRRLASRRAHAGALGLAAFLPSLAIALSAVGSVSGGQLPGVNAKGRAPTPIDSEPGVQAAFEHQSYLSGETARLRIFAQSAALSYQLFQ